MDTKSKCLQLLGAFGIVEEAFKIIQAQAKLLGDITLVLILPFYLIAQAHSLMAPFLLAKMIIYKQITEQRRLPILQLTELLVLDIVYADFFYAALMPFMAAVVYTVASVYTEKHKPSFLGVMRLLPALWKRMMMTCLWYFIIDFVIFMTFGFALCLLALGFLVVHKSYAVLFYVAFIVVCVVLFRVRVYVRMVSRVAIVVCVLEKGYYGLEGMKKSHCLMEGKSATAWVLTISYLGLSNLFGFTATKGNVYVVGLGAKTAYGISCVVIACVVALMGVLTQSVLYFVCKAHHGESIDELCFSQGCLGEYHPVNNKEMQSLDPLK